MKKILKYLMKILIKSEQFNISVEDIKSTLGNTDIVKNDVRIQKVIDLLRDNAKYVEATKED